MIRQILKIVWAQRRSNFLIWLEMVLVSLLLWMVLDHLFGYYNTYRSPNGFNIDNTYYVNLQMLYGRELKGEASQDSIDKAYKVPLYSLLDRIKRNQNVEVAAVSYQSRPYNGGNSWSDITTGKKSIIVYLRMVDPEFFDVFKIPLHYGVNLKKGEKAKVVISKQVADSLFGSSANAVGKRCRLNGEDLIVAGVTDSYKYYDFSRSTPTIYEPTDVAFSWALGQTYTPEICFRLKENAPIKTIEELKKQLSNLGDSPYYIVDIVSFDDLRDNYLTMRGEVKAIKMNFAIIIFFLINVLIGIVGTFWFRTEQRKNEIGLRMAIGSSMGKLRGFFLLESMVILILAFIPATIIAIQLRYFDVNFLSYWNRIESIFILGGIAALLILSAMTLLGTWIPVYKASKIQPSEALHYE